jgi:hypothetical protein
VRATAPRPRNRSVRLSAEWEGVGDDGYTVDPTTLQETAKGINDTIGALKGLGMDEKAEVGRGFGNLSMTGMQVGHQGLQQGFADFADRWSWGVRALVQDGNQYASLLGVSAGTYNDMEQYAVGLLKDAVNSVVGDPHASDQQVQGESFGQILARTATPDYSAASWRQTGQDAAATWSAEGRDVLNGPMGLDQTVADATGHGHALSQAEDSLFGDGQQ